MSLEKPANDPMDFMKNMWGNMGFSLPGMVTPTFDVEEIEKRITDLKAVEGWLKMNLSMLQMTIQSLEMQCVTLNAVRAMGQMAGRAQATPSASAADMGAPGSEGLAQAAMWPWHMMQQMQEQLQNAASQTSPPEPEVSSKPSARRGKKSQ